MTKKGKVIPMPERGERVTFDGIDVGPKVSERDAHIIVNWLTKAHKDIEAWYRRRLLMKLPGWQCLCACHRLTRYTSHCIGCDKGQRNGPGRSD